MNLILNLLRNYFFADIIVAYVLAQRLKECLLWALFIFDLLTFLFLRVLGRH